VDSHNTEEHHVQEIKSLFYRFRKINNCHYLQLNIINKNKAKRLYLGVVSGVVMAQWIRHMPLMFITSVSD